MSVSSDKCCQGTGHHSKPTARRDSWLIMPKLLYFWMNMAIYTASSFIAKYFNKEWNLEEYQIALMMSLQIVMFFGAIFWTGLADRVRRPKIIVMTSILGYAGFFVCLGLPFFTQLTGVTKVIASSIMMAFTWIFGSCFYPVIDSTILIMLSRDPNFTKDHFSSQRMWGAPAHILGILGAGYAYTHYGTTGYQTAIFSSTFVFAIIALITLPSTIETAPPKADKKQSNDVETGDAEVVRPKGNPTWILLSNSSFFFFLLFGLSGGIIRSCLSSFQTHHMEANYKKTSLDAALTSIPRIASEMLVHSFAKRLCDYFGNYWLLMLSQIAGLFRVFGYTFAPAAREGFWSYFPFVLEVTKGLNSGLLTASYVRIASDIAPPGCESTAQGLFSGTYTGLSMFVGGLLAAFLLYTSGNDLKFMFGWIGCISFLFTVLFFFKFVFFDRLMAFPGVPLRRL